VKLPAIWCLMGAAALALGGLGPASALAASLTAAAPDSFNTPYRLEEVVVYGEQLQGLGMITELRGDELTGRGGSDAAHLLRLDPALAVTSGAKAETETRLRGMPAHATLILIDGRPVNPGYYGKVDLSMIAASNLAAVQIIKGPASAAYGPNAMGGVINIITRSGFDAPGTHLGARFGGHGARYLTLGHALRQGALGLAVHVYEERRDGFRLSGDFPPTSLEDGGLRTGSAYHKAGAGLKAGFERSDHDIYTLTLDYHWSRREIPPTIYGWESPTWRRFPRWMRYGASLNNQRRLGRALELTTVLHADGQQDRLIDYLDPSLDEAAINWDSRLQNRSLGGSLHLSGTSGLHHRFRTGLTYKHDVMNKQPEADASWTRHTLGTGSLFLEDRFTPGAALALTGSLQTSWHTTTARPETRLALSPALALRWHPLRGAAVRAAYSHATRYPTMHALFSQTSGNPDLRPETASKYEVGLEHRFVDHTDRRLTVEVAWFRSDLTDLIDRPARSQQFRNVSAATLTGIETAVRASLARQLAIEIGHVWIDRQASTDEIMRELPPHRLSLGLTADTSFGLRLRYDLTAQDERTTHVPERTHLAFQTHNLTVRQRLDRQLTLHFEAINLTDVHYEEELGYPAPGRTFSLGLDWRR